MSVPQSSSPAPLQTRPKEGSALQKVTWFGILQLVSLAAGWASSFYVFSAVFTNPALFNLQNNPTPADISAALAPLFQAFTTVLLVTAVVEVVALIVLTLGFRELKDVDGPAFSLPSTLMILMLIGTILLFAGLVPFFNSISGVIAQAPSFPTNSTTPSPAFFSAVAPLVLTLAFIGIGGLLTLIGLVGGQILGLWRIGAKYDQTIIKLGAIFAVIPVLNIAAPVLVIVGAHQARHKVLAGA